MDILERAIKTIAAVQAGRKRKQQKIDESAGPFRYEYVSISHVLGAKLPDDSPEPLQIAHFPDLNATAYLTHNWDEQYFHIDRANSSGTLLLTGMVGIKRFKKLSRYVNRFLQWIFGPDWVFKRNLESEAVRIRKLRLKEHSGSGCCLVYRAQGQVNQPVNLRASRRFAGVGIAIDAIDGSVIRGKHKLNVRSVVTAASIAMIDSGG
ncbi:MAG: hypothetical protein WBN36_08255, partial [Gammaproteobacteria bacterium]